MILVTGATGFLGKRVCRALSDRGMSYTKTSISMGTDLREPSAVRTLLGSCRPVYVLNCAAYVGGIGFGYKHSAELFHNNLLMTLNLLKCSHEFGVKKIVNPISNCAYPADARVFKEEEFWNGPLHESVMVYGFVRKASWVGSWAYQKQYGLDVLNLILSNMYGPEDHFDEERSHALGALIMKIVRAKQYDAPEVLIWGSGKPIREWLHVDDGAEAMIRGIDAPSIINPVNVGIEKGISIIELANLIKRFVGYEGRLVLDESKPDGAPYKTVDGRHGVNILRWGPTRDFEKSIKDTIDWYLQHGDH